MSQKLANEIQKKYPTLEVEYQSRRGQISVYGFHTIKSNVEQVREDLESMGFQLGPNSGTLKVEQILEDVKYEKELSQEQIEKTVEYWSR